MKFFFEFFPILIFFGVYRAYDIFIATGALIVVSIAQIVILKLQNKPITKMQITSLALIVVLGGITLLLRDEMYLKWKVTIVNAAFGLVFLGSHFVGNLTIIERILSKQLQLDSQLLRRLNFSWAMFFFFLGALNLWVIYTYDTETWVNFKLFGLMGLTIVFSVGQAFIMSRAIKKQRQD